MVQISAIPAKPGKRPLGTHVTEQQRAKLKLISDATGRSISDVIGWLIDQAPVPKCAKK